MQLSCHPGTAMPLVTQPLENDILFFLKAQELLYDHEFILSSLFIPSGSCMPSITYLLFLIHSRGSVKLLLILLHISLPSFVSSHSHFPHCRKTRSSFPISVYHCPHLMPGLLCKLSFTWLFLWIFQIDKNFPSVPAPRPCAPSLGGSEEERGWGNQLSDNIKPCSPEVVISGEFEVGGEGNCCQCACHVFLQVGLLVFLFCLFFWFFLHHFCLTVFIILSPCRARDGTRALAQ